MPRTKIVNTPTTAKDLTNFGSTVAGFYGMFAGTQDEQLFYDMMREFQMPAFEVRPQTDEDLDEDNLNFANEHGFDLIDYGTRDGDGVSDNFITENDYRENEFDRKVNQFSDDIDRIIASGRYPEDSAQRFALDYVKSNINRIKNRELYNSPNYRSMHGDDYPAVKIVSKGANLGFIPLLSEDVIKNFKPENVSFYFQPKSEQQRAAFTEEELQESFKAGGVANLYKAGFNYANTLDEIKNTFGAERPSAPEQQRILKERLLDDVINLQNEITKVFAKDTKDPLIQRMYDGSEKNTTDNITSEDRGYITELKALKKFETYLKSGLPVEGFYEFNRIIGYKNNFMYDTDKNTKYFSNTQDYMDAVTALEDKLDHLPPAEATKAETDAYIRDLRNAARKVALEYNKFLQDPKKIPAAPNLSEQDKARFESEQNQRLNYLRNPEHSAAKYATTLLESVESFAANPGAIMYNLHHEKYLDTLASLEEDRITIGEELTRYKKAHGSYYSPELNNLIDETIKLCDKNADTAPDKVAEAVDKLRRKVKDEYGLRMDSGEKERINAQNHLGPLESWVDNNKAYLDNKIGAARRKGILTDESVRTQQLYNEREGRVQIEEALNKFNTSRIVGKETFEHKLVRESAEKLNVLMTELGQIDKSRDPDAWTTKAKSVMEMAKACSEFAENYIEEKGISLTFAGSDRKQGAKDLIRETEVLRVGLKKEISTLERYKELKDSTRHIEHVDETAYRNEFKDQRAGNDVREELGKTLNQNEISLKEKMDSVCALYSASVAAEDEKIKTMAGDTLKDVAFKTGDGLRDLNLDAEKTKEFFKDLGRYSVNNGLDYAKGIAANESLYGDARGLTQVPDKIVDKLCENVENDPRIRRYNNKIKQDDKLNDQQKAEKMINADKIRSWYEEGQNERINEFTPDDMQLLSDMDDIINEAIEDQKVTRDRAMELGVPELAETDLTREMFDDILTLKAEKAFIKQEAERFEEIYKEMYDEKRAQLDAKDIEEANRKEADRLAKEAEYEKVRNKQAAAKEARGNGKVNEIDINKLKEKAGFKDKAHDNAHDNVHERKSISNKNAVQKQNANKPEEEIRRVNSF